MPRKASSLPCRTLPASSRAPETPSLAGLSASHHLRRSGRLGWIAIKFYDATGRHRHARVSLGSRALVEASPGVAA
jgi:hypothetical protein